MEQDAIKNKFTERKFENREFNRMKNLEFDLE